MDFASLNDDWKRSIRSALELGETATPTPKQIAALKILELRGRKITDLEPLRSLTKLEHVILVDTQVSDPTPVASLPKVTKLWVRLTKKLKDLTPIEGMKLEWLQLHSTGVGQKVAKAYGERHPECTVDTGR